MKRLARKAVEALGKNQAAPTGSRWLLLIHQISPKPDCIDDPALHRVAEVVHDVDLKDGKYGHAEAAGIDRLIAGLAASSDDDEIRLAQGSALFASLYESYGVTRTSPGAHRSPP